MADVYTTTGTSGWDTTAYDQMAYFALRPQLFADQIADVQPTRQSHPGATVTFTQVADLAVASTALSESVDVDAVALSDTPVSLTLAEYGNAVVTTAKLRGTSYIELDPVVANVLGHNAGISIDTVAMNSIQAGTNVRYAAGTSRATVTAASRLTAAGVRTARVDLVRANVADFGGLYAAMVHPDAAMDLRTETGAAAWRDPHVYSQPAEIWNGEVGAFEGFRFLETPRAPLFVDAGDAGTTEVYATLFMGRQAIAKAFSTADGNGAGPRTVPGPITDKLRRFVPMGWYWLGAYGVFRQAAIRRLEHSSSYVA